MSLSFPVVSLFSLILSQIQICISTRYYVDGGASSGGLGASWNSPFNTLDTALSSATTSGDEVWLKGGYTYIPSNPSDRTDCFIPNSGITIYGGFDGSESDINRNINNAPSIISGDIGIINDNTDNCFHVIQYTKILSLDNVIISDGYANYNDGNYETQSNRLHRYGGGIITTDIDRTTSLHLNNVIIRNNTAINGGGLWISSSATNDVHVIITDCKFQYNQAIDGMCIVSVFYIVYMCKISEMM